MRLRFLGTGTSAGVPIIGCDCRVCTSADPRDTRLRTAAALEFTDPAGVERVVLIDAGPDLRQQALSAGLRRCDGILVTHAHVDHVFGLDEVRRFNAVMDAPIDIYADADTLAALRRVYQHIFDKHLMKQKAFVATLIPRRVEPARPFELHGLRITPIPLLHGRVPVLGYRFDLAAPGLNGTPDAGGLLPLAWCTDVSAIPPESWPMLEGLNTLALDALRDRRHPTHFTIPEALTVVDRVRPRRTRFIHMGHEVSHAEMDERLPSSVRLAFDGLTLE